MKKIAVVTATRAEYGLLTPLIQRIDKDRELELNLIVTGTHLSPKYGYTIDAIRKDGFLITHKVGILEEGNAAYDISLTMANAIKGFAECFRDDRPDMVVILGDRTELLGIAAAAVNEHIPVAHIHGGEVTEGAVDDYIRHALSKMSYLHFTSTEVYQKRVIQLGEDPSRVFNVGALGTENILHQKLISNIDLREELGIPQDAVYAVVTYHPVTLEDNMMEEMIGELCAAMEARKDIYYLITAANADVGGEEINRLLIKYAEDRENINFVYNLGMKRYLSAVKYASFVMGNSSSGILEAPVLGVPTINIGERQRGRLMAESVVNCPTDRKSIIQAMEKAEKMECTASLLLGDGRTSERIVHIMKDYLTGNKINLKKGFYEVER